MKIMQGIIGKTPLCSCCTYSMRDVILLLPMLVVSNRHAPCWSYSRQSHEDASFGGEGAGEEDEPEQEEEKEGHPKT